MQLLRLHKIVHITNWRFRARVLLNLIGQQQQQKKDQCKSVGEIMTQLSSVADNNCLQWACINASYETLTVVNDKQHDVKNTTCQNINVNIVIDVIVTVIVIVMPS
jgi:hypothetical protein